jgi:predicted dehydrogenase
VQVLTEKPPGLNGGEARALAQLQREYGVKIAVCFQNRCNPGSVALKRILESGEYGAITGLRGIVHWRRDRDYYSARPWRGQMALAGGGCVINQAIHTLDLMIWFAGGVETVSALSGGLLDFGLDVEDTAVARLGFQNGAAALFTATVANYRVDDTQLDIACEGGAFSLQGRSLLQTGPGPVKVLAVDGRDHAGKPCYGSGHSRLVESFYAALAGRDDTWPCAGDGIAVMDVIDAMKQSARAQKPVRLPCADTEGIDG